MKHWKSIFVVLLLVAFMLPASKISAAATTYTVKSGDSLWKISVATNVTVAQLKSYNKLTSDTIYAGQVLRLTSPRPTPVLTWPSKTYIVQEGDYLSVVSKKFGVSMDTIVKFNYMRNTDEWLNVGQKLAINGYAPRNYAVFPGESTVALKKGTLTDWFLDGQYVLKRNDIFQLTDVKTGLTLKVRMLGGLNHTDVEPLTTTDTAVMRKLFATWTWTPRPVVIFHNGMNIAASLSGMPHSFDTISTNGVTGHFDLYLYHSKGHSASTSATYIAQHQANVLIAAGLK